MEIENNLLVLTMTKLTKCKISQVKQRPLIKFNKVLLGFCGNKKKSDPNHVQSNRSNDCCYHHHTIIIILTIVMSVATVSLLSLAEI